MTAVLEPTPLHSHTLETLCTELVSGRAISTSTDGEIFQLADPHTRSLFSWYHKNQIRWAGNVRKEDVEALVDSIDQTPPVFPITQVGRLSGARRGIYVKKLEVHNFAGIHRFPDGQSKSDNFIQSVDASLVLIQGVNGSGKTSLLSALCWALTGSVFRSQRAPEDVSSLEPLEVENHTGGSRHNTTPITPLPPASYLSGLGGKQIPLDTWVEVTFADEKGNELGKVRRTLTRTGRGKPEVSCSDIGFLGLDPIALRVGTTMPGLIPYIQLGEGSELGKAIATLTGIQPLESLASHAIRVRDKLKGDFAQDRKAEIQAIDEQYLRIRTELDALFAEHLDIKPDLAIPIPTANKGIEETLTKIKTTLGDRQATAFSDARNILGEAFDPANSELRRDLKDSVAPALGLIEFKSLGALPSAHRLSNLRHMTKEEIGQAESLIAELLSEASELADIAENPKLASRLQLYARIAGWIKAGADKVHSVDNCPICQTSLHGKVDPQTERAIRDHIQELLSSDKSYLEKTLSAWVADALRRLAAGLCKTLQGETHVDLPSAPSELIRSALTEEFFSAQAFEKSLSSLRAAAEVLCDEHLLTLPLAIEPLDLVLPSQFKGQGTELIRRFTRVNRAIAFASWRETYSSQIKDVIEKIVGNTNRQEAKPSATSGPIEKWTLAQRLFALSRLVENATPITEAIGKIDALGREVVRRRAKEARIALYERAAVAIEPLTGLGALVERQVKTLMDQLGTRTQYWRKKLYQPAYVGGPSYVESSIDVKGAISMNAEADGTRVPAQHVSNTSDLRATLLAFLMAFWEHLRNHRGVLSTILLDDLQELFDPHNRQRIANAIPEFAQDGARPIITTNDQDFARKVLVCAQSKSLSVDHKHVHPLSRNRASIVLAPFEEEIDRKRQIFESPENQNQDQPGRDYIKDLRIYLENRLLDLFDERIVALPDNPTLSDLLSAVRGARGRGHEAFASRVYEKLVDDPALKKQGEFMKLMNQSHHGQENLITYNAVWTVRIDCRRVRELVDSAYYEYQMWIRGDSRPSEGSMPSMPATSAVPTFNVPVMAKLAAFVEGASAGDAAPSGETLDGSFFQTKGLYYIKTQNFGFSGAGNFRALVSLDENREAPDNSLVIAISGGRTYARRLIRNAADVTTIALATDVEDPRRRPPSEFLRTDNTRLLPVTGIILDESPNYNRNTDEATPESSSNVLAEVKVAFRVDGDSALPLALPGQTVLGGDQIAIDQLAASEGTVVAIATSDGDAYLKRVGMTLPGIPYARIFESISGRGDSIVVKTEMIEDGLSMPVLVSCRRILAVLY